MKWARHHPWSSASQHERQNLHILSALLVWLASPRLGWSRRAVSSVGCSAGRNSWQRWTRGGGTGRRVYLGVYLRLRLLRCCGAAMLPLASATCV
ncbi:hypothetical protein BS50DRAFT_235582 [Corynespora cassiicola Philippines]|uniref:Secreted protein n=1 Tax=Corynespora cassiicola Philippines TaxID=1448308 RepID=A0A2T2P2M7_CORCC|nr:hypothetical protein BS50DRAFT_235582 [Corynespora cassiicola Philippines]